MNRLTARLTTEQPLPLRSWSDPQQVSPPTHHLEKPMLCSKAASESAQGIVQPRKQITMIKIAHFCTRLTCLVVLTALSMGTVNVAEAGGIQIPAEPIRALLSLPADGTFIEQGRVSIDYVVLCPNFEVRGNGKSVVRGNKIGDGGIVFRDGFIEINLGVHVEKELKIGPLKPTVSVDGVVTAQLTIDDSLKVAHAFTRLDLHGDNLGGKLALLFAEKKVRQEVHRQAQRMSQKLTGVVRKHLPVGPFTIQITRHGLLVHRQGPRLSVLVHLQDRADRTGRDGQYLGTRGESRRLEGFSVKFDPPIPGVSLKYMAHLQDIGDTPWTNGFVGTRGQHRRLEGFAIKLEGPNAHRFSVQYQAHIQNIGDRTASDGVFVGTRGQSLRVEGILVRVVPR